MKKELEELALQLKTNPMLSKLLALTYEKGIRDTQLTFENPFQDRGKETA